jgi:hypothetical protein
MEAMEHEMTEEELAALESGDVDAIVAEMAAVEALLEANRKEGPASRAITLAEEARLFATVPSTVEGHVVDVALAHVLADDTRGTLPAGPEASPADWSRYVFESVALAWCKWVVEANPEALGLVERLRKSEPALESGALTLAALYDWAGAVEALASNNMAESKKRFERALEAGAQLGLDATPTIMWTYAASFFTG